VEFDNQGFLKINILLVGRREFSTLFYGSKMRMQLYMFIVSIIWCKTYMFSFSIILSDGGCIYGYQTTSPHV